MKRVAIIQARMTSTRLPGKVLMPVLGRPLLDYQLERLRRVPELDDIWLATTTNKTDEPLVDWCQQQQLNYVRGDEQDVLSRYLLAAEAANAQQIVRVTSDCPLLDPSLVSELIRLFEHSQADYASNGLVRTYPRGLDAEIFTRAALERAASEAVQADEREHVTPYLYRHPEHFKLASLYSEQDYSVHRWTVDTPEDLELVRRLLTALYPQKPQFSWFDLLELMQQHPEWRLLNAHIEQKKLAI